LLMAEIPNSPWGIVPDGKPVEYLEHLKLGCRSMVQVPSEQAAPNSARLYVPLIVGRESSKPTG